MNYTNMTSEEVLKEAHFSADPLVQRMYEIYQDLELDYYTLEENSTPAGEGTYDDGFEAARLKAIEVLEDYL